MTRNFTLWVHNIHNKLHKKSNYQLFIVFSLLLCAYSVVSSVIINYISPALTENNTDDWSLWRKFLIKVIFTPIIETFIFQALIIEVLLYYNVRAKYILFLTAGIFAFAHYYNIAYVVVTFFVGLLYAYYYYILQNHNKYIAILWVVLLHASWNFIVFLIPLFMDT